MTKKTIGTGFTLIEILVVVTIIAVLIAIAYGVFAHSQEDGGRASCLSNEKQVGLALLQYEQDNDERFPSGTQMYVHMKRPTGEGWAGQIYPYVKNTAVFRCPNDPTQPTPTAQVVSYGYNMWIPASTVVSGMPGRLPYTAQTVLLFEVGGSTAQVTLPDEGKSNGAVLFSAAGDGGILATGPSGSMERAVYATGWMGGSAAPATGRSQYPDLSGRHKGGSNFLLVDGHAKWLSPERVFASNHGPISDAQFATYEAHFLDQNYGRK